MVNLESGDTVKDNIEKLKDVFQDIVKDGKIDFDTLKLILGEEIETESESYKFEWVGKKNCYKSIQTPSNGTLKYVEEDSLNPDTNENLIIEGDNLEVLKLLQSSYKNSIKMIYIDPPYNTGNDFVYPDNFKTPLENYLEITGQKVGGETTQSKKSKEGRKHTQWLNMMFPRLLLSRTLLKDDGVIFISIDDNEVENLKRLCDEIFGEENLVGQFIWQKASGNQNDSSSIAVSHEYILCYSKSISELSLYNLPPSKDMIKNYNLEDEFVKTRGKHYLRNLNDFSIGDRPGLHYDIKCPDGSILKGDEHRWRCDLKKFKWRIDEKRIVFEKTENGWQVFYKQYINEKKEKIIKDAKGNLLSYGKTPDSMIIKVASTGDGKKDMKSLFEIPPFSYPKPVKLLRHLLKIATKDDDIILDFFAGSGTTGHSVLELNNEDEGSRKFILVQLPEPIKNPEYHTISEITKERVRRVIQGYGDEPKPLDDGFKVFKLDNSNYKVNEAINVNKDGDKDEIIKKLRQQFKTSTVYDESMVDGYTELDVIYENILKEGYGLNSHIEVIEDITECKIYKIIDNVKKSKVFYITFDKVDTEITTHKEFAGISNDTLFICFDNNLSDSDKQNLSKTFRLKTM